MPINNLNKILKERLKNLDVLDYGLNLEMINLRFQINIALHSPLAISYAISLANIGNVTIFFLLGLMAMLITNLNKMKWKKCLKNIKRLKTI